MNSTVRSFSDLDVYKRLYQLMLSVHKNVLIHLPREERFELGSQLRRSSKSPVALIAEGYARKNYRKDWQKYIKEAIGECNEMIVHLSCCRDLYAEHTDVTLLNSLIEGYDIGGKQLYRLGESWHRV